MQSFGITDTGIVRKNNEDSLLLNRDLQLFIVADGMGGHAHGEIASRMAVRSINEFLIEAVEKTDAALLAKDEQVVGLLKDAVLNANEAILSYSREMIPDKIMGTTVSFVFFRNGNVYLAHVGDSRICRLRNGQMEKLTTDHNETWELVEKGLVSEEDADNHWQSNILTRALGVRDEITPEIQFSQVEENDQYLLCSDGLSRVMTATDVADIMRCELSVRAKCQMFIDKALEGGAPDNVTVIIIHTAVDSMAV